VKILIQNYSNNLTTRPMYLNECFQRTDGVESFLWNPSFDKVYDTIDKVRPDVLLTSYATLNEDLVKYLNTNKLRVVCDITGAKQDIVSQLDSMIPADFYITENFEFVQNVESKRTIHRVYPCHDMFLSPRDFPAFDGVGLVATKENEQLVQEKSQHQYHHTIHIGKGDEKFDMSVYITLLANLYDKYNQIILCDSINVATSQLFFDGLARSQKFSVKLPPEETDLFPQFLKMVFEEEQPDVLDLLGAIKQQVMTNHTCFNRAKELLDLLGKKDVEIQR